jgi:ParB family chromosome partitioning protein
MTTTITEPAVGVQMIALDRIRHDSNVRELAAEDVDALAGSIALLGQITPAIVRPDGDGYVLVAGHKRYAALQKLGRTEIRAEIRDSDAEHSEPAAENIVRTQLNAHEEAQAVKSLSELSDNACYAKSSVIRSRGQVAAASGADWLVCFA